MSCLRVFMLALDVRNSDTTSEYTVSIAVLHFYYCLLMVDKQRAVYHIF